MKWGEGGGIGGGIGGDDDDLVSSRLHMGW